LIYTSSIDVIFTGQPFNGDVEGEDLPYPEEKSHMTGYITTKIRAEKALLELLKTPQDDDHDDGLAFCILRPMHIYGPNDMLLRMGADATKILSPVTWPMFGTPKLSFVYVKNVAHAHYLASEALRTGGGRKSKVHGQIYMIGEGSEHNAFEYIEKFGRAKNLTLPMLKVPTFLMYLVAMFVELVWYLFGAVGIEWTPLFTRFIVIQLSNVRAHLSDSFNLTFLLIAFFFFLELVEFGFFAQESDERF
jgi:nucleoside-diphosphate-sugar epimerase